MAKIMRKWNLILLILFLAQPVFASNADNLFEWMPDRRKEQFPTEQGHLFVPLPYSYPGIGEGFFLIGYASNLGETTMDGVIVGITGDATGTYAQLDEASIIDETLLLSIIAQDINRAIVNNYEIRGMSDSNDYKLNDVTLFAQNQLELTYTYLDRRVNFIFTRTEQEYEVDLIRNPDGSAFQDLDPNITGSSQITTYAMRLDFTDDYLDPRRGFRMQFTYADAPPSDPDNADFYKLDYDFQFYIPYSSNDVLVVNYYQSDAHVREAGNLDPANILSAVNINCTPGDTACDDTQNFLIQNETNARTNGTATPLGGLNRLRSYPQDRYSGGHMAFIATEYRWNMTDEETPFNYLFWKDVRTGKQIAFFAEAGSVSETSDEIWDEYRTSYGVGFRLVTASGTVYRADIANGDEGSEVAIFFFYPW